MSITATEALQREHEVSQFELMAQRFFERWQPEDHLQASEFHAQFFMLVRQIHADAGHAYADAFKAVTMGQLSPMVVAESLRKPTK